MRCIYVADVGDGLCMSIFTVSENLIQVDCGSAQGSKAAVEGLKRIYDYVESPNVFILSHFHIDHYNGLLLLSTIGYRKYRYLLPFRIKEVYFPRIPDFKKKREFAEALFTMNLLIFGSETGVMEYDFLKAISRINMVSFNYKPLSQGDVVDIYGSVFEVVWPPKQITEESLMIIEKALSEFYKALEEDKKLRELYERVNEEGLFEKYFREDGGKGYEYFSDNGINGSLNDSLKRSKIEISPTVRKVNKSLREAANHLSLAFFEDNRILFMGM